MDLKDIKGIIELMKKNSISEFELEKADFKVRLRRGAASESAHGHLPLDEPQPIAYLPSHSAASAPHPPSGAGQGAPGAPGGQADDGLEEITSPMIGTFYRSPSPEAAPYSEVGTEVDVDSVVCIIEAMKVMNEIKAEIKGTITEILVENAKPVEYGQPLYKVRPAK